MSKNKHDWSDEYNKYYKEGSNLDEAIQEIKFNKYLEKLYKNKIMVKNKKNNK